MSSDSNPFDQELRELERSGELAKFRERLVFAPDREDLKTPPVRKILQLNKGKPGKYSSR